MNLCDKLAGFRKHSIWPASLWVSGKKKYVECLQWVSFQLFDFVAEKVKVFLYVINWCFLALTACSWECFIPAGLQIVGHLQFPPERTTEPTKRSWNENCRNPFTEVLCPLKPPENPFEKRNFKQKCAAVSWKSFLFKRLKVLIWQVAFQKKYFILFFCYITEGFVTYFCIRLGPLGSDGRIPSCIGTCTCPTQIHGQRWGCTGGRKRCRGKTRGDYQRGKPLFSCCKFEVFEVR